MTGSAVARSAAPETCAGTKDAEPDPLRGSGTATSSKATPTASAAAATCSGHRAGGSVGAQRRRADHHGVALRDRPVDDLRDAAVRNTRADFRRCRLFGADRELVHRLLLRRTGSPAPAGASRARGAAADLPGRRGHTAA